MAAMDSYELMHECADNLQMLIKDVSRWFVNRSESATYAYHNVFYNNRCRIKVHIYRCNIHQQVSCQKLNDIIQSV